MTPHQPPTPKARSHGIAPHPGKELEPLARRCKALDKTNLVLPEVNDAAPSGSQDLAAKRHVITNS